jgi:glycosyltransferase involved in cell wall biosynthesis
MKVDSTPMVSVLMPCYNAEQYLNAAIKSIVHQTYQNLHILLINDGSTDATLQICQQWAKKDNRIELIQNESNLGLIKTLNKGISIASSPFIARMDADDVSDLARIEKQLNHFYKNPHIDVLGSAACAIDLHGNKLNYQNPIYCESNTLALSSYFIQPFFHGSVMIRTNVLKKNLYSKKFKHSEDFELWLRLNTLSNKLCNLNEVLYYYRINPEGVSINNEEEQKKSHNNASQKHLEELIGKPINSSIVHFLNNRPSFILLKEIQDSEEVYKSLIFKLNLKDTIELNKFIENHLMNIYLQALKMNLKLNSRIYLTKQLVKVLFKSNNLTYFRGKFNRKFFSNKTV